MAGTHAGKTYALSTTTIAPASFDQAAAEALTFTAIGPTVGQFPPYGKNRALATYDGHDKKLYGFGNIDYGSGPMQVPHEDTDPGQIALRAANKDLYYVIRVDHNDETGSAPGDMSATTDYLLAKMSGPHYPEAGSDEDFKMEEYQLGFEDYARVLPAEITT